MMTPTSEQDVAQIVRDTTSALNIIGGGTRPFGHATEGDTVSSSHLNGIKLYEPGALTIVAQAGTPVADIEHALAAENQQLAFEPMDHRPLLGTTGTPTIGGVVAANVSGPRRISAGAARDFLLGVRFVDGHGDVVKNGGRVMKNVTGYDLVKLMAGSFGTLGILTEVSFKTLPAVEACATLSVHGLSISDAVATLAKALGSPYEVSGAAYVPSSDGHIAQIRIEGFEASVKYRAEQVTSLIADAGEVHVETDVATVKQTWADVRDVTVFADRPFVGKLSIKPSDAPHFHKALGAFCSADIALDWAGGLIWVAIDTDELSRIGGAAKAMEFLQHYCSDKGGHATCIKSPAPVSRVFQPQNSVVSDLSAGLRKRFDPRGILNPKVMV